MGRRTVERLGIVLLLAATMPSWLLGGCLSDFDPPSKLDRLRILAIRAEPPEIAPFQSTTLDALVWVPGDGDDGPVWGTDLAEVTYSWRACFLASASFQGAGMVAGGPTSCFDVDRAYTMEELAGLESPDSLDLESVALDLGHGPTATFMAFDLPDMPGPESLCFLLPEDQRKEQGGRELWVAGLRVAISLRVEARGEVEIGTKRLVVRPRPAMIPEARQGRPFRTPNLCLGGGQDLCAANVNPEPPTLTAPNREWDPKDPLGIEQGGKVRLLPDAPGGSDLQAYVAMASCGEQVGDQELMATGGEYARVETRFYSWFASVGEVLRDRSHLGDEPGDRDSGWEAPDEPASGDLFVVARDGRGGVSWTHVSICTPGPCDL